MYFLLPAYADSHDRLPKSYGGQGILPVVECVAGIRRSSATRNEGGYASAPALPEYFVRQAGVSPDEESGGAMGFAHGAPQILFCIAKNIN